MGKFEITKRKDGEFQFNLKAGNGEIILSSEGYSTKINCTKGIESVRKNSMVATRFEQKYSTNNKYYFNLKASNGQIIGTSQMYKSSASCMNGIESVKKNAPSAEITDLTVLEL
ncbi:MAG TPA: YegP family protein [Dysgonomonas sp.]|uniref:YegP family protein n=1 Tax=unclassified Dysgonomonas TaxID=2630389 RepID=UPI0025C0A8FC|nr:MULTISPECIES: YegP family protein [unclassified Dysgonomonas]HML66126.1 YegP family protein [Dysgonomonas sp.]